MDRKQELLEFLVNQLFEYDFMKTSLNYAHSVKFESYEDFVQTQTNLINTATDEFLQMLILIKNQILPSCEVLIDDITMFTQPHGFYLDKSGKVIFIVNYL